MNSNTISATGFFSFVFVSRLLGMLMFIVTNDQGVANSDVFIKAILAIVFILISLIPIAFYIKRFKTVGIIDVSSQISPFFGKVVALIYIVVSLYVAVRTAIRFDLFASSAMFPDSDVKIFVFSTIIVCAYIASLGLRAIGRSSSLFAIFYILCGIFVFISVTSKVDLLNLTPLFIESPKRIVSEALSYAGFTVDFMLIPFFLPRLKGNIKKSFFTWFAVNFVFTMGVCFFLLVTLGKFAEIQMFPSFVVSLIGEIGMLQRMDAFETAIWIFGVVIKISLAIMICAELMPMFVPVSKKSINYIIPTTIVLAFTAYIIRKIATISTFISHYNLIYVYFICVIVLPLIVIIANVITERKKKNGAKN